MLFYVSVARRLRWRCYHQGLNFAGLALELLALDFRLGLPALHWDARHVRHINIHVDGAVDVTRS